MNLIRNYLKPVLKLIVFAIVFNQISCTPQKPENLITLASNGKIESLDPAQANKLLAIQLISTLGDTLYRIDSNGSLEPRLARGKPILSSDGLTISIPLREDVLFHDGTHFDSEAMAFSIKRFQEIGTLNYIINDRILQIDTPEKYLLKIKLSRPSSSINGLLTSINLTPISPSFYSKYKDKFLNNNIVATGPYKLSHFSPERISIKPFDNYWDQKSNNFGINYISFNTSTSLFSAIKTGQVDILLSNSIEDGHRLILNKLSQEGILNEGKGPAMQIGYIAFRTNSELLKEKKIRQALSYSIDRELISNQVSYGQREPLRSLIPPILQINSTSQWPKFQPDIAKNLFKEAGYCNGEILTIPLTFRSNVPSDKLLALTWQEQIKRDLSDCLKISLNGVESTTVYKQLSDGIYDAVILEWTGDYPDPYSYLSPLLDCKQIKNNVCKEGEAVIGGTFWGDLELQDSLDKSELLTGEERLNELRKVESIAAKGLPIIPIWNLNPRAWTQPNLNEPEFDGSGRLRLDKISNNHEQI